MLPVFWSESIYCNRDGCDLRERFFRCEVSCSSEILGLLLLRFLHKQQRADGGKALPRLPDLNWPLSDATLLIPIERIAA
jgi:hypothetical protein